MDQLAYWNPELFDIKHRIYDVCGWEMITLCIAPESTDYKACQFTLNGMSVCCRNAKVTPKKVGQFVTFWKRNETGVIAPFQDTDTIDYLVVNVSTVDQLGQFVFPKSIAITKGILSTVHTEGKRGFRVYPPWDVTTSKQAQQTQQWQLNYFYTIEATIDFKKVKALYYKEGM